MPGLVPRIHVLTAHRNKAVDGRGHPGHDEKASYTRRRNACR